MNSVVVLLALLLWSSGASGSTMHILVDTTGSLGGGRLATAWEAAQYFERQVSGKVDTTFWEFYGVAAHGECELRMQAIQPEERARSPQGTCTPAAYAVAKARQALARVKGPRLLIVITDGFDNSKTNLEDEVRQALDEGIHVVLVGFMAGVNSWVLGPITKLTGVEPPWEKWVNYLPADRYREVYKLAVSPYVPKEALAVEQTGQREQAVPPPRLENIELTQHSFVAPPVVQVEKKRRRKVLPWVLMGVGVAAAGIGGVLGYSAQADYEDFRTMPMTDSSYLETRDSIDRQWIAADVLYGVSVLTGGAGLTWLLWSEKE